MGSAAEAKVRLFRLPFADWRKRVEEALSEGGRRMDEFPNYPWRSWHAAGLSAGKVAVTILAVDGVRTEDGRLVRLND